MPLSIIFAAVVAVVVPPTFAQAVAAHNAKAQTHLVDWWADDLDGDQVPESIALVCNDETAFYLVQKGNVPLTAPHTIDGRNSCDAALATPPPWRVAHKGVIDVAVAVHHGHDLASLAIRNGQLVTVAAGFTGIEVDRTGTTAETSRMDFDALTWVETAKPPRGRAKKTSGPLVVITDVVRRPTKIVGETTLAASRKADSFTLHVHAASPLTVRDCTDKPCKITRVAKGDIDIERESQDALDLVIGNKTFVVHFEPLTGDQSYPVPML